MKLPLTDCAYEDAYIEIGLKGALGAKASVSARRATVSTPNANAIDVAASDVAALDEELKKSLKEKRKLKEESD